MKEEETRFMQEVGYLLTHVIFFDSLFDSLMTMQKLALVGQKVSPLFKSIKKIYCRYDVNR